MSLPDRIDVMGVGLDPSWADSINEYARSPFVFGRDVVFTYGPLGFILRPLDLHENLRIAFACRALIGLGVAGLFAESLLRGSRAWQVAAAALGFAVLPNLGVEFDYQVNAALLLACIASLTMSFRARRATLVLASAVAAAIPFMNLGMGVLALAILSATGLVLLRRDPFSVLFIVGTWAAVFASLAWILFPSPRDFASWLSLSRQLVGGYDLAMSVWNAPASQVVRALEVLAAFAAFAAVLLWSRSASAPAALLGLVPLALSFKHSFVRHDLEHSASFFALGSALALAIVLTSRSVREACAAGALAFYLLLMLGSTVNAVLRPRELGEAAEMKTVPRALYRLRLLEALDPQRRALREIGTARLRSDRLPEGWRD